MALSAHRQTVLRIIERHPGHTWPQVAKLANGQIKYGMVHRVIVGMHRDELIMKAKSDDNLHDIWLITEAGRKALDEVTPPPQTHPRQARLND